MKIENTFTASVYVGLREHYTDVFHTIEEVEGVCLEYCSEVGLCVTVTPTKFIYKNGNEPGCIIGFINYPRFAESANNILQKTIDMSRILLSKFNQYRITIVCQDKTYMLESDGKQ